MDNFPSISTVLAALKRNSLIAAITFVSATLGSTLYLIVTPPIYESSARIMLQEGEETISDLGRALTKLDGPGNTADPLATQSELITSEAVLSAAIEKLKSENMPFALTVPELRERVRVEVIPATNILELSYSDSNPEAAATVLDAIVESTASVNGEAIRQEASTVRKFLEEQLPREEIKLAQVEAAENQFRQENRVISLDEQVGALIDSLSQVENEERQVTAQLQELREKASLLQQVTGTDEIQSAYDSVRIGQDASLNDLRDRLVNLEASIVEGRSRLGDQHPELQALLQQREELQQLYQRQLEQSSAGSQPPSNEDLAFNALSQDLMTQLISNQIAYESLSKRLIAIQSNKAALQARLAEIPSLSQPLSALVRERQATEEALRKLRSSLEEARIAEAQLVSNIRVLGKASVPANPSKPSKPAVLVLGMAAGVVLALSSVVLSEALDTRLRSDEEVKAFLGLPIIGTLPPLPLEVFNPQDLDIFLDNPNLVAPYHFLMKALEYQYTSVDSAENLETTPHHLRTPQNLRIEPIKSGAKIILISNAFPEGSKSSVVRYLAAVTAMLGQRTLIVDVDLHSGSQSHFFRLYNSYGLTDIIRGEANLLEACKKINLEDLSILPVGHQTDRPSAIIESPLLRSTLEKVATHYDWLILDAAPISESSELITLSQIAGGLVLVLDPNSLHSKYEIGKAIKDFQLSGGTVLGAVLNEQIISKSEYKSKYFPHSKKQVLSFKNKTPRASIDV